MEADKMAMAFTHTCNTGNIAMPHIIIPSPSKSTTQALYLHTGLVSLIYLGWELLCVAYITVLCCVYKQCRSCQLPFCASPTLHFEI